MHLTGIELLECIALRRVREVGVAMHGSVHLDQGRKMPCYLPEVFSQLAEAEWTELRDSDFPTGPRRVVLTPRGRDRLKGMAIMKL